jgi:outer membrane protein OmpA-like peptidoglycan-associated protein
MRYSSKVRAKVTSLIIANALITLTGCAKQSSFDPPTPDRLGAIIADTIRAPSQRQQALERRADTEAENTEMIQRLSSLGVDIRDSERGVVINLPDVLFKTGSADLAAGTAEIIAEVAQALKVASSRPLLIEGHTDNVGTIETNHRLSEARARAVSEQLQLNGIPSQRVTIKALGETTPIATNRTAEGRARNRRVELIVIAFSRSP